MEVKERIKNYYRSEKIEVDDEFVNGVITDKDRANKLIKFFEPIELNAMNYIFGKEKDNKQFSELELNCASKIDLFDIKVVNLCKIIWDNKDNEKRLNKFMDMISNNDRKIVNREGDKHMNDIMIFKNDNFGEIRSLEINNEPWFVAKDACDILELKNTTMAISRLDKDEVTKFNLGGLSGETNIVNEYGLYNLILASRKKEAKAFKRWITHEVIPSIRKNGAYSLDTNGLMKQLTESQITLNNVLAGFKMQIDNDFKVANEKITEHDELLKKRVYLSPKEAKDVQVAVREKAKSIAIENDLPYHKVKGKLFKRLYMKLNEQFEVGTYRELPSIKYEDIIQTISNIKISVRDIQNEEYQIQMSL